MEDIREDIHDWQQHPVTRAKKKQLAKAVEQTHDSLLSVCAVSTDPKVREAHAQFVVTKSIYVELGGSNV